MTAVLDRPSRPPAGVSRPYHFPRFERTALPNGLRLVVAPVSKLPLVTITVLVEAGAVSDPPARSGLAQLTAKLLLEGTTSADGVAITDRFERLGASIEASADWDVAAVTMTTLTDKLSAAFALLGEVLRAPAFHEREVERLKGERLAELLQLRAEPRGLADELFSRFLYEPDSRYAAPNAGDEKSVRALTRDMVAAFYAKRYSPAGMTMVVVGDVKTGEITRLANEVLNEIERFRTAPVTEDELSLATSYLDGVFPIRFETTAAIASALTTLVVYDLPDDWYDVYRERVRAVTSGDVLIAADRHLHPE